MPSDMDSWARPVRDYKDIPEIFRSYYDKNLGKSVGFLNAVYAPADSWGKRKTNEKLLILFETDIVFLENVKNNITSVFYPIQNINYIENGSILLYSWIKINGEVNGETKSSLVEYNTVVESIFKPIINKLRILLCDIDISEISEETCVFDCLIDIDYKFMNYAKNAILNGEKVIDFIYQREIKVPYLKLFTRIKSTSHMAILTNKELIILKEENAKSTKDARYGGIWIYIPVHKILSAYIEKDEIGFLNLVINISGFNTFKSVFEISIRERVEQLVEKINRIARFNSMIK